MNKKTSLKDLQQQVAELTEALQRERADAENVRRRADDERSQMASFYKAMIIRNLLPIIDNTERLLRHISTHSKEAPWKDGAEKIVKQTDKVLAELGVERIKTVGQKFDPKLHEAISVEAPSFAKATEGRDDQEIVSEELQPGYTLGDEVIRHAMVRVKTQSAPKPNGEGGEESRAK